MKTLLAMLLVAASLPAQVVNARHRPPNNVPPTPSNYWSMDEASAGTRTDAYGSNNLADSTSSVTSVAGILGNAAKFDGTASHQLTPSSTITIANGTAWSLQMWLKCSSFTNQGYFGYNFTTSQQTRAFSTTSANIDLSDNNNQHNLTAITSMSTGAWHHVVYIVGSDKSGKVYVDNALYGIVGVGVYTGSFTIARFGNIGSSTFPSSCAMDEVALWNGTALTAAQVSYLYNGGSGRAL